MIRRRHRLLFHRPSPTLMTAMVVLQIIAVVLAVLTAQWALAAGNAVAAYFAWELLRIGIIMRAARVAAFEVQR